MRDVFWGIFSTAFWVVGALCFLISIIMTVFIVANNTASTATKNALEQERTALVYQLKNNLYENDNDYGKKELYNQIESYNKSLAFHKGAEKDFWVGIFYPNIYDDIEFIEYGVQK